MHQTPEPSFFLARLALVPVREQAAQLTSKLKIVDRVSDQQTDTVTPLTNSPAKCQEAQASTAQQSPVISKTKRSTIMIFSVELGMEGHYTEHIYPTLGAVDSHHAPAEYRVSG
jgi:hypothetical protein